MAETIRLPALANLYRQAKEADPGVRARDLAGRLGLSEGALAEIRTDTGEARRLALRGGDFLGFVRDLATVGPVMALTRNATAVHEVHGRIERVSGDERMGQVLGSIDLRLFLGAWHAGYEIAEETRSGFRRSFQVFDATGTAVLKIYGVAGTDWTRWAALAERHRDATTAVAAFAPAGEPVPDPPDEEIDRDALRREWLALEHSHDFDRMLRELGIGRRQALRLAGEDLARRLPVPAVGDALRRAADRAVALMCFVGNAGCLQIFAGRIEAVRPVGPWLNVLDPGFNLHLRTDRIAEVWRVVKPTALRGEIASIEVFDTDGALALQLFGARAPGAAQPGAWRRLVETVEEGAP